jgi:hypothetical protein
MMVFTRSISLAAVVFSATSLFTSVAWAADPLMPNGPGGTQPFDDNPGVRGSMTNAFMTYGIDSDNNSVPVKTLRITNNSAVTMYPVMRSPNTGVTTAEPVVAIYDPYDPPNMEYRGYIGYKEGTQYYFGLKPGQSILVTLPLVFWNGARIGVGTDGEFLAPGTGVPNPQHYDSNAQRSITLAPTSDDTIPNGAIMWYRANVAMAPADDAEDQLAEWTVRDHFYMASDAITTKSHGAIPDDQVLTLMNYDVSNVDNLYLPLAMAANDVWLLNQGTDPSKATDPLHPNRTGGWTTGSRPDVFGWTGSVDSIEFLQSRIGDFTANNNVLLGQYFGGKGWPFYNFPNVIVDPSVPIKVPSGANIFPQSPMKGLGARSSYDNEKYLLSSGGTGKISVTMGAEGDQSGLENNQIRLTKNGDQSPLAFIQIGYLATGNTAGTNPIPSDTTVTAIDRDTRIVTFSNPLVATAVGASVTFTRPKHDYAAEAMIRLWYSWADYYIAHWKDGTGSTLTAPTTFPASNVAMTAELTFNEEHPELVKGMSVTGPGLDNAQTEVGPHQGDAVILEIAGDHRSVVLSQVMASASSNASFTFSPPKALLHAPTVATDPGYPRFPLVFDGDPIEPWHAPYAFSQQVYLIMASMNQIGVANNGDVFKFMQDIVGANMGYILTADAKATDDGKMLTSLIRDMIKSVLRGVSDFTVYPDTIENGVHTTWYPDPTLHRGGQQFNVYNLDPYVRFVHVHLGFSGYGFSVDDDTADIGADGPSHLQLSIAGPSGLKKNVPWTNQAPYGPVKNVTIKYSGPARQPDGDDPGNGDSLFYNIANVSNTTPVRVTPVAPHGLANGAKIIIDSVVGDPAVKGTFIVGNVTKTTFDLFDGVTGKNPIAPTGNYVSGGRWGYPLRAYFDTVGPTMPSNDITTVFCRVTGDDALGTFLGTSVSVNGVDRNPTGEKKKFRVWQRGQRDVGRLIVDSDLTDAQGNPLSAGPVSNVTFFGDIEATPTPTPAAPNVVTSSLPNAAYVQQLRTRINAARKIDDPDRRALTLTRLRAWLKIVNRGVDPDSPRGLLLRRLVNARTIVDPDRRKETVERLKKRLEKLDD